MPPFRRHRAAGRSHPCPRSAAILPAAPSARRDPPAGSAPDRPDATGPARPDAAGDAHHERDELAAGLGVDQQLVEDRRGGVPPGPPWSVLRASCPARE